MALARREVVGGAVIVMAAGLLFVVRPVVEALLPEVAGRIPAWENALLGTSESGVGAPMRLERAVGLSLAVVGWLVAFRPRAPKDPRRVVEGLRILLLLAGFPALCLVATFDGASELAATLPFVAAPGVAVAGSAGVAALLVAGWIRAAPTVLAAAKPSASVRSGTGP